MSFWHAKVSEAAHYAPSNDGFTGICSASDRGGANNSETELRGLVLLFSSWWKCQNKTGVWAHGSLDNVVVEFVFGLVFTVFRVCSGTTREAGGRAVYEDGQRQVQPRIGKSLKRYVFAQFGSTGELLKI